MALGTQIFYYLEDTLAALQALETADHFLNEPLTWGHFVRDTTNDADYWVQPGTGDLVARLAGANYGGFSLFDGVTDSGTVESGEQILLGSTDSIALNAINAAGTPTMTAEIVGIEAATLGTVLTVGASGSVVYVDPDTIGGFTITDDNAGSEAVPGGDTINFVKGGGIDVDVSSASGTSSDIDIVIDGLDAATNGQYLTVNSGTLAYVDPLTIAAGSTSLLSINGSNELSVSNLLITDVTVDASADLATFIAASYTVGTEFQAGDVIILTTPSPSETYIHNGGTAISAADFSRINESASGFSDFVITANAGADRTVLSGESIDFLGSNGLTTFISGNDLFVGLGPALASLNTNIPVVADDYFVVHDGAGNFTYATDTTVAALLDKSLSVEDQVFATAREIDYTGGSLTLTGSGTVATQFLATSTLFDGQDVEITDNTKGLIIKAANNDRYRITVNNIGALVTTIVV